MSAYLLSAQPGRLRQRVIVIRLAESVIESILANSHLSTPHPIYYSDRLHYATPRPRLRIRAYTMMASPGASKPRGEMTHFASQEMLGRKLLSVTVK